MDERISETRWRLIKVDSMLCFRLQTISATPVALPIGSAIMEHYIIARAARPLTFRLRIAAIHVDLRNIATPLDKIRAPGLRGPSLRTRGGGYGGGCPATC